MIQVSQTEWYFILLCSFGLGIWIHYILTAFIQIGNKKKEDRLLLHLDSQKRHNDLVQYNRHGKLKKEDLI